MAFKTTVSPYEADGPAGRRSARICARNIEVLCAKYKIKRNFIKLIEQKRRPYLS